MIDNLTTTLINMTNMTTHSSATTHGGSEHMPWYVPLVCAAFCGSLYVVGKAYETLRERQHNAYKLFKADTTSTQQDTRYNSDGDWNPAGLC